MSARHVSYADMVEVLGKDAARALHESRGGISIYVPMNPKPDHPLAQFIGLEALETLCAFAGGESLSLSNAGRHINKPRILRMLEQGQSAATIALECGVTERYVNRLASDLKKTQRQCSFLGDLVQGDAKAGFLPILAEK